MEFLTFACCPSGLKSRILTYRFVPQAIFQEYISSHYYKRNSGPGSTENQNLDSQNPKNMTLLSKV